MAFMSRIERATQEADFQARRQQFGARHVRA
jgi:hypothetical protein